MLSDFQEHTQGERKLCVLKECTTDFRMLYIGISIHPKIRLITMVIAYPSHMASIDFSISEISLSNSRISLMVCLSSSALADIYVPIEFRAALRI